MNKKKTEFKSEVSSKVLINKVSKQKAKSAIVKIKNSFSEALAIKQNNYEFLYW
jgi:hypothetical protein